VHQAVGPRRLHAINQPHQSRILRKSSEGDRPPAGGVINAVNKIDHAAARHPRRIASQTKMGQRKILRATSIAATAQAANVRWRKRQMTANPSASKSVRFAVWSAEKTGAQRKAIP